MNDKVQALVQSLQGGIAGCDLGDECGLSDDGTAYIVLDGMLFRVELQCVGDAELPESETFICRACGTEYPAGPGDCPHCGLS